MAQRPCERGYTLVELLVVVGIIVVVLGTMGALFFAGPSPAVASAARDVETAFVTARAKAAAFGRSTLVFAPNGNGFTTRLYRDEPRGGAFGQADGLSLEYDAVTVSETAAPLGAPGFAFVLATHGDIIGLAHYQVGAGGYVVTPCPASGNFLLSFTRYKQTAQVQVNCRPGSAAVAQVVSVTPAPAAVNTPSIPGACSGAQCAPSLVAAVTPTCPPGTIADPTQAYTCDPPTPPPTAPPTSGGPPPPTSPSGGGQAAFQPGSPSCSSESLGFSLTSSAPSGGSGSGYAVTYQITSGPAAIGAQVTVTTPFSYDTGPVLQIGTYGISATYTDSAGDTATASLACTADSGNVGIPTPPPASSPMPSPSATVTAAATQPPSVTPPPSTPTPLPVVHYSRVKIGNIPCPPEAHNAPIWSVSFFGGPDYLSGTDSQCNDLNGTPNLPMTGYDPDWNIGDVDPASYQSIISALEAEGYTVVTP